jgi:hypothetical protein
MQQQAMRRSKSPGSTAHVQMRHLHRGGASGHQNDRGGKSSGDEERGRERDRYNDTGRNRDWQCDANNRHRDLGRDRDRQYTLTQRPIKQFNITSADDGDKAGGVDNGAAGAAGGGDICGFHLAECFRVVLVVCYSRHFTWAGDETGS